MKTLYINLNIPSHAEANSLLVDGNRIAAIGKQGDLVPLSEQIIDMEGLYAYPGFHDSHMHLSMTGQALICADLSGAMSIEDIQSLLLKQETPVVHGMGWDQERLAEKRMPTACDLDAVISDRPVIIERSCTHILSANTKAMELTGMYSPDGIFKEDDCRPFTRLIEQDEEAFIDTAVEHCLDLGLCAVQCADLKADNFRSRLPLYKKASEKIRIHHQVNITNPDKMDEFLELFADYETPTHTIGPFKGFADGALGGRTAYLKEDYADDPGNRGIATMDEAEMRAFVSACKERNRPVVFHAIGDGAIEQILSIYRELQEKGNPMRWGILHVQITDESILQAFEKQQILALMQPVFWKADEGILESRVGKKLAETSYAFGRLMKTVPFAMGTDCPIEDCDPFQNIHYALHSQDPLTLDEALQAYTVGSAFAAGKEHELGQIEPGFLADLTFLDGPIDPENFPDVVNVMVNGSLRFKKPGASVQPV